MSEHQEHIVKPIFYVVIWASLLGLTALTAFMSTIDLEQITGMQLPLNAIVAMLIAGTKASLVALFFMHMRWSDIASRIAAVAGLFWLAIMFLLTCTDFFTRHWLVYPG